MGILLCDPDTSKAKRSMVANHAVMVTKRKNLNDPLFTDLSEKSAKHENAINRVN